MWYSNLENKALWKAFDEISRIPRASKHEEAIRKYLIAWASEHGLECKTDKIGNIVIKAPASKGLEKRPAIAIQAHVDMVCVKTADSDHDFSKDPISIICDGKTITADRTTLGGDDGIGVAIALSILADKEAKHGPIEGIFTVDEETGMTGAINIDPSIVDAKYLINLDSETEGEIAVGCAGGMEVSGKCRVKYDEAEGYPLKVRVSGLLGGHSGSEIHLERGNAIKIVARYLNRLPSFQIASFTGGTLHNVIPFSAEAVITVPDKDVALSIAENLRKELENEFRESDPGLKFEVSDTEMPMQALKRKKSQKIADALLSLPHGVRSRIPSMMDTVETSVNFATARLDDKQFSVVFSIRSMIDSKKMAFAEEIETILETYGFTSKASGASPAWEKSDDTEFAKQFIKLYKKISGKTPQLKVLHGILECGILASRIPGLSAISIGPDVKDVHSVKETLSVASSERIAACVREMLPLIK